MSEGGPTEGPLAMPIFLALGAFFVCSALVPAISVLIEALANGVLTRPESIRHTGCTLTDALGGWLQLSCDDGSVTGALARVEGAPNTLGVAIRAFIEFHGVPLTCDTRGQALECLAGDVVLNDHLTRHGFAPPSMAEAQVQREAWLATLLGFAGAIVAFIHEQRREREVRAATESDVRAARKRRLEVLRTKTTEVLNRLQTAMGDTLQGNTEEERRNSADHQLSLATEAGRALARDLATVLLPEHRIRELQAVLNEVERVQADSYQYVMSQVNEQFNLIDQELSDRLND